MNLSIHTAPHQYPPISDSTVASQCPQFVELSHIQCTVFQFIKVFLNGFRFRCMNELMYIRCYQNQIRVVILSAQMLGCDMVYHNVSKGKRFFTDRASTPLRDSMYGPTAFCIS